jgi:SAM-dependent methyltransferase
MTSIYSLATKEPSLLKQLVGSALTAISPHRSRQLIEKPLASPVGLRDKAIMLHLKNKAAKEGRSDFIEQIHEDFWKGEGGKVFASNCDHRFEDLFLKQQKEDFAALLDAWGNAGTNRIVEFGCNSGLLLNYLSRRLPGVEEAVGLDINADQIAVNQQSDSLDSRICFVCGDARKWLFKNGTGNSLYVSNGGVLEYFQRERLDEMLTHIAKNLGPSLFFASEPVACDHDWSSNSDSLPFGDELSFSHNYKHLFESNGFEVLHQRATDFESWRMVATVARAGR